MFGQGGTAVEVIDDKALALPPLNMALARRWWPGRACSGCCGAFADGRRSPSTRLRSALIKLSQLVTDWAEIVELDINPLLADEQGVVALDARIRVRGSGPARRGPPGHPALPARVGASPDHSARRPHLRPPDTPGG